MSDSREDRWLLPRRQTEHPTRELIAEEKLHGRREATFLVLAAVFLVTTASLIALGTSRIIDPAAVLAVVLPDTELPIAMQIPFGVLPFALGSLALTLVAELYGRRRAWALVGMGLVSSLGLAGLMRLADRVDGSGATFGPALGFASCYLLAYLIYVPLFDALRWRLVGRHLWLRVLVLSLVSQLVGWAAFGAAIYGYANLLVLEPLDGAAVVALATGSALYTLACIALLTLPIALVARGLALFLRVARHDGDDEYYEEFVPPPLELTRRRLPPAHVVDDGEVGEARAGRRRAIHPSIQPFSSAEMRFFREGDQLAEPADS